MTKIVTEIKSCAECPHLKKTNPWSSDGWDKMEDWVCGKTDPEQTIQASVEWHEEKHIKVPEWCPISIKPRKPKVDTYRITTTSGITNWSKIDGITEEHEKALNEIGYTGKLGDKQMRVEDYFEQTVFGEYLSFICSKVASYSDTFIDVYNLTRVELV